MKKYDTIIGIDPGTIKSAYAVWSLAGEQLIEADIIDNHTLEDRIKSHENTAALMACEMIACYGMAVGKEVFDTCVWVGRFIGAWLPAEYMLIPRKQVCMNLCQSKKANDSNIRWALIDRFGAVGTKKMPGPLYGVTSHMWAALGVAVTALDVLEQGEEGDEQLK